MSGEGMKLRRDEGLIISIFLLPRAFCFSAFGQHTGSSLVFPPPLLSFLHSATYVPAFCTSFVCPSSFCHLPTGAQK